MLTAEQEHIQLFSILWFTVAPVALLMLQYGWDMFFDAVVPVHPNYQGE